MKSASETASRSAGGCTITPHSHGRLTVSCDRHDQATLTYAFSLGKSIKGTPWCSVTWIGYAEVHRSWNVVSKTLRVTVTVTDGTATLSTVNVGYYT